MKGSTAKKLEQKRNNLPLYFVDSSVFLEVFLKQAKYGECVSFFNRANYKYRLTTSILVLGETLKTLNKLENQQLRLASLFSLWDLFKDLEIDIISMSFECINNVSAIKNIELYLMPSDCLIFSSAITENSDAFITLDSDFSNILSTEFGINIKKPSEA